MAAEKRGLQVAGHNYVGQDQIWKDHVKQEMTSAKKWPENWQFMTTKYEDLVKDEMEELEEKRLSPPKPVGVAAVTPLHDHVKVAPSPQPVPQTTASLVGWRSTDKSCQLEVYGRYAKPKGGLVKQLNWPTEGIE